MHIEIQVALNFVISYLYNKLPRRRVNIFGEELEKALRDKFQGHWYPEKPFKGSAFRCLKTGDPIDAVLHRAARESGVPISDILENLPAELAVWVDPGEVSYRIGEKGIVKILFSEITDHRSEDTTNADREVTRTFNPDAQCFQPIDAVSNSLGGLSLSPKQPPQDTPPILAPSPAATGYVKHNSPTGSGNAITNGGTSGNGSSSSSNSANSSMGSSSFLPRSHAPLTFTTATFAQTKFGSTKLKTNSKRTSSRMSPTEFSNYIKQRAMQQQLHHSHNGNAANLGPIGPVSPSRSLSPNPLSTAIINGPATLSNTPIHDPYFFPSPNNGAIGTNVYPTHQFGHSNPFDAKSATTHFTTTGFSNAFTSIGSTFIDPNGLYGLTSAGTQQHNSFGPMNSLGGITTPTLVTHAGSSTPNQMPVNGNAPNLGNAGLSVQTSISLPGNASNNISENNGGGASKLLDGINSFYSSQGSYQHLLVAN